MTIFRNIENWTGDNTGLVETVQHKDSNGTIISSYDELTDKPLINGVILQGDVSLDDLNIQPKGDYVSSEDIPSKISELENDKGYLTSVPEEYITEDELNKKGYLTEHQDLSAYAKNTDIPTKVSQLTNDKNYITSIPEEYVTENELNAKGFITSYTESDPTVPAYVKNIKEADINNWNAKSEFSGDYNDLSNKPAIPSINGLATEKYVNDAIAAIPATDLSKYATLDDVDDAITEIVGVAPETLDTLAELAEGLVANRDVVAVLNDSIENKLDKNLKVNTVTITSNHASDAWYSANAIDEICASYDNDLDEIRQGMPTKVSQLSNDAGYITGYAETDPTVPGHVKAITTADITNWNNKSTFSGNYNDLSNKPTIPTVPTNVSAFTNDKGYITSYSETDPTVPTHVKNITTTDILNWNAKSTFSGDYNDLTNKPSIPSITGLATETYVNGLIASLQSTIANLEARIVALETPEVTE